VLQALLVAIPAGVEPATHGVEIRYSAFCYRTPFPNLRAQATVCALCEKRWRTSGISWSTKALGWGIRIVKNNGEQCTGGRRGTCTVPARFCESYVGGRSRPAKSGFGVTPRGPV